MSYEGTTCVCGDKKAPNTMLCDACLTEFADHQSMRVFHDIRTDLDARRHAAMILLEMARGRKRKSIRPFDLPTCEHGKGMGQRCDECGRGRMVA